MTKQRNDCAAFTTVVIAMVLLAASCTGSTASTETSAQEQQQPLQQDVAVPMADTSATVEPRSTPTVLVEDGGEASEGGSMTEEEAEEFNRELGRTDLEAKASAEPAGEGSRRTIRASLRALDRSTFFAPTLIFDLPASVTIAEPVPEVCEPGTNSQNFVCVLKPVHFAEEGSQAPTDWLDLELSVDLGTWTEPQVVTVTAVSEDNPLDVDPDPTNNIVELELQPSQD